MKTINPKVASKCANRIWTVPFANPTAPSPISNLCPNEAISAVKSFFGGTMPVYTKYKDTVLQQFSSPYQPAIADSKILCIPCGPASDLCAMVFKAEDNSCINQVVGLNPSLTQAEYTIWRNFKFLWLRLTGWRPPSQHLGGAIWISNGLVPVLDAGFAGHSLQLSHAGEQRKIPSLKFDDLVWPSGFKEHFRLQRIESQHGSLLLPQHDGTLGLNHQTCAHYLAEASSLKYNHLRTEFTKRYQKSEEGVVSPALVNQLVGDFLLHYATNTNHKFPGRNVTPSMVNAVVSILEVICAREVVRSPLASS